MLFEIEKYYWFNYFYKEEEGKEVWLMVLASGLAPTDVISSTDGKPVGILKREATYDYLDSVAAYRRGSREPICGIKMYQK